MRVKSYIRQFKENPPTVENFNKFHAAEAGPWCVLEADGIPLDAAVKLVESWNRNGHRHGYFYKLVNGG